MLDKDYSDLEKEYSELEKDYRDLKPLKRQYRWLTRKNVLACLVIAFMISVLVSMILFSSGYFNDFMFKNERVYIAEIPGKSCAFNNLTDCIYGVLELKKDPTIRLSVTFKPNN